jgi:hypothetical protein
MRSKLETIVGYLAFRDGPAADRLRAELADPASEASRFLEAARQRTRGLVADRARPPEQPRQHRRSLAIAALAAGILGLAGAGLWLAESRIRSLEATLARREAENRDQTARIERALALALEKPAARSSVPQTPTPVPAPVVDREKPTELALARLETGLGRLERRLEGLGNGPNPGPDPAIDATVVELKNELGQLRRDLTASNIAGTRQMQELRSMVIEVGQLVRVGLQMRPGVGRMSGVLDNPTPSLAPEVEAAMNALSSPIAEERLQAADQLSKLGQAARPVLSNLQQHLSRETDSRVRASIHATLRNHGN